MVVRQVAAALLLGATFVSSQAYAATSLLPSADAAALTAPLEARDGAEPARTYGEPAQEPDAGRLDRFDAPYLKGYFTDSGKIVSAPLHWGNDEWLKLGLVLGGTSALLLADGTVQKFSQDHQSTVASGFAKAGTVFGTYYYMVPALGSFYLYGYLGDDHKARRTALLALESFTITGILTTAVKTLSSRHRPDTGHSPTSWDGPGLSSKNVSFASGHTSTAFSLATVVADQYKDNPYVPPLAYGLATLTGLSRVYDNQHWSSDVFFGAALGYFVGKAVLSLHKHSGGKRLTLIPGVERSVTGLSVKYDF